MSEEGDDRGEPAPEAAPLEPARLDSEEKRPGYMPRVPWKWVVLIVGGITVVGGGYWYQQRSKAIALREQILRAYDGQNLAPVVERFRTFRGKLERWTRESAAHAPTAWADRRLRISALGSGQGLYLRLHARDAATNEGIERAAAAMEGDAITRCLGVAPISARTLFEKGSFLSDAWIDEVRGSTDLMRLRVKDDELARLVRRDLPSIVNTMRSRWFLLVIERGASRRDGPVDVFLWDLHSGDQLLRVRTVPNGILIPVRIASGDGTTRGPRARPDLHSAGAYDCSVAAQIKEVTGEPSLQFGSVQALEDAADAGVPPDAGPRADAGPPSDAGPGPQPATPPRSRTPPPSPPPPPSPAPSP